MTTALKTPYGERDGVLVHISDVARGIDCGCVCPACGVPLIARKGESKRPHFAHASDVGCSRETLLHVLGKRVLRARLEQSILDSVPLGMTWECEVCSGAHQGNLTRVAKAVELERSYGPCRPDLALIDADGRPVAFVEVVVSHAPEAQTRDYAAKESIRIVEFHLDSFDQVEALAGDPVLRASRVDVCLTPRCLKCQFPMLTRRLQVFDANCWSCGSPMKLALVDAECAFYGPEEFTPEEADLAAVLGATLVRAPRKTLAGLYLCNSCPTCGRLTVASSLYDYWTVTGCGEAGPVTGYECLNCVDAE